MIITKKTEGRGDVVNKIENAWSEWQFNCMRLLSATAHLNSPDPQQKTLNITTCLMVALSFNSR